MQGAGRQLLAGPRLAGQEDGGVGRGQLLDLPEEALDGVETPTIRDPESLACILDDAAANLKRELSRRKVLPKRPMPRPPQ